MRTIDEKKLKCKISFLSEWKLTICWWGCSAGWGWILWRRWQLWWFQWRGIQWLQW